MIADIVLNIGSSRFYQVLFDHARECAGARQLVVQKFSETSSVQPLAIHSTDGALCESRVREYVSRFHRTDPLRPLLTPSSEREIVVRAVKADQIADVEYRERLFAQADLAGKLCLMVRRPEDALCLTLYRGRDVGAFGPADLRHFLLHGDVISAALERHCELVLERRPNLGRLIRAFTGLGGAKPLSEREAAVCAYIVSGHSNLAISLHLGISFHSVTTYRRRAYQKLNISSQAQLFAAVLAECGPEALGTSGAYH